jgi:hypothetical protein
LEMIHFAMQTQHITPSQLKGHGIHLPNLRVLRTMPSSPEWQSYHQLVGFTESQTQLRAVAATPQLLFIVTKLGSDLWPSRDRHVSNKFLLQCAQMVLRLVRRHRSRVAKA